MKLFLASEAKHPESIAKLRDFVPEIEKKKIIYIPTAANGEFYGSWKDGESIQVAKTVSKHFDIVQLEDYLVMDINQKIISADVIWMAGGISGYLLYWIRRLQLNELIPKVLDNGIVYVGSSAGSMVCSKTQFISELYPPDPEPYASTIPGLGLIKFEIYPHFENEMLPDIKKVWKKGTLYLLKNGEVITVHDKHVKVFGEKRLITK
jgi:dipeptidase E